MKAGKLLFGILIAVSLVMVLTVPVIANVSEASPDEVDVKAGPYEISGLNSTVPPDGYQAKMTAEIRGNKKLVLPEALLIQDVDPWEETSNVDALNELGISYDLINSTNLATQDLSGYKFIMYASDQPTSYYTNIESNISKIEDFVSNGGLLIAHVCDWGWNAGDWDGMHILPNDVQRVQIYEVDLVIADTSHPVIQGTPPGNVDIFAADPNYFDGWGYSSHGYLTNLATDVVIKIESGPNTDEPTYIDYSYGSGKVLATMQTVEWGYSKPFVNRPELLRNELRYADAWVPPDGPEYQVPSMTQWGILAGVILLAALVPLALRRRSLSKA